MRPHEAVRNYICTPWALSKLNAADDKRNVGLSLARFRTRSKFFTTSPRRAEQAHSL